MDFLREEKIHLKKELNLRLVEGIDNKRKVQLLGGKSNMRAYLCLLKRETVSLTLQQERPFSFYYRKFDLKRLLYFYFFVSFQYITSVEVAVIC